jgi:SAM-dependent methyltransferase
MPFVPARRRGVEILDDPSTDADLSIRSLYDVAKANRLFGGSRAIITELDRVLPRTAQSATLLDVGTGLGDIPASATRHAHRRNVKLTTIGVELDLVLAREASRRCTHAVVGSAMQLPFPRSSIDFVTCSQVLHHFDGEDARALLRECSRVARCAVIVGDLRRSWLAVAGLWASSFLLGFHPVSRHDGIVSILRGFTVDDLDELVHESTGANATVRKRLGWRVTAVWQPDHADNRNGSMAS